MSYGDHKIDIHQQHILSDSQCDIAIAIWVKYGVFDTESNISDAIKRKFREEVVWRQTFSNYDPFDDADNRKLKRLTTQVINRYRDTIKYNGVARVDYRKGNESWCVICKPEKTFAVRQYNTSVCSAATHIVKANKTNDGFQLEHRMFADVMQKIDTKVPHLIERRILFEEFKKVMEQKTKELDEFIALTGADEVEQIEYDEEEKEE